MGVNNHFHKGKLEAGHDYACDRVPLVPAVWQWLGVTNITGHSGSRSSGGTCAQGRLGAGGEQTGDNAGFD